MRGETHVNAGNLNVLFVRINLHRRKWKWITSLPAVAYEAGMIWWGLHNAYSVK